MSRSRRVAPRLPLRSEASLTGDSFANAHRARDHLITSRAFRINGHQLWCGYANVGVVATLRRFLSFAVLSA